MTRKKKKPPFKYDDLTYYWRYMPWNTGNFELSAVTKELWAPVCTVWCCYGHTPEHVSICNSHTHPYYLRRYARSHLNSYIFNIFDEVDLITSADGTKTGKPFMLASGYKEKDGGWHLTRKVWERKRKK